MLEAALIGARLWHYIAVLLLFGVAVFPAYGFGKDGRAPEAFDVWIKPTLRWCAVSALISGILWLLLTTAVMAGDLSAAFDPATLTMTVRDTDFGRLWSGRLVLAAASIALALQRRSPAWALPVASALLLGSLGWAGHAALMDNSSMSWLHCGSDGLHLLAAGVWVGALAAFGNLLRDENGAAAAPLARFSGVGAAAVAVLVGTGVLDGWIILGEPDALFTATYGWLLIAKVGLFGVMLAFAAANRLWLTPRLMRTPGAATVSQLRVTVAAEQGLALLVLGLVAVLGTLDPKG